MEEDNIVLSRTFKDHPINILFQKHDEHNWTIIASCEKCDLHHHINTPDLDSQLMFIDAEMHMHASGVDDGWAEGPGFIIP